MARAKRRILLIDANEDRLGELKFVLETRGYSVIRHARGEIHAILAHWPIAYGIAKRLKNSNPETPLIVLCPCADSFPQCAPVDMWMWNNISRVELLERVHILAARKRGPKKRKGLRTESPQEKGPASHGDGSEMTLEHKQAVRDGAAA